jgi:simple sugar transport system ATP-binding protein
MVDGREQDIHSPTVARALGIGMVYQHFTVVPGMTVAENLLVARGKLPAVIHWPRVKAELREFMERAPFQLDLDATPLQLSAGEKQKLEILKQLYLQPRLLILDEPTSVLTPQEADEVLGALRERAHAGDCSVVMITHKFREVTAFADDVTVLRRGRLMTSGAVQATDSSALASAMVGGGSEATPARAEVIDGNPLQRAAQPPGAVRLQVRGLVVHGDRGERAVDGLDVAVRAGEIVGIAGVSGNGQRELMEALTGQRAASGGTVQVSGRAYHATRAENRALKVRSLPEEPLRNGCVGEMAVADNIGLRRFDVTPFAAGGWRRPAVLRQRARELIAAFGVKTRGELAPISSLSGGNVQRAVLARELSDEAELLLVSNPVFGLDFVAVAEVHARLVAARNQGAAVLMVSEDLDELLHVADRIVVMSGGRLVYECPAAGADRHEIGRHMGGHAEGQGGAHAAAPASAREEALETTA